MPGDRAGSPVNASAFFGVALCRLQRRDGFGWTFGCGFPAAKTYQSGFKSPNRLRYHSAYSRPAASARPNLAGWAVRCWRRSCCRRLGERRRSNRCATIAGRISSRLRNGGIVGECQSKTEAMRVRLLGRGEVQRILFPFSESASGSGCDRQFERAILTQPRAAKLRRVRQGFAANKSLHR